MYVGTRLKLYAPPHFVAGDKKTHLHIYLLMLTSVKHHLNCSLIYFIQCLFSVLCMLLELSKLLTNYYSLTAVKIHVIRYCEKVYERSSKNFFWSIKNSGEVINKLKLRGFRATSLSTYDFSTLYTTLPHNLIKEKLNDLIEWSFERECCHTLPVTNETRSIPLNTKIDINVGHVKICVKE